MLTDDTSYLIGFGCEAVLWGAYCILFIGSMAILVSRRRTKELNLPLVFANGALFLLSTAHFGIQFNHYYTILETTGVIGFGNETRPLMAADIFLSLIDLLGDLLLCYRCWLVWGKSYSVIIFPCLTAVAGFACIMQLGHVIITLDPTVPAPPAYIVPLGIAGYTLPLCTNFIVTTLIVGRIWYFSLGGLSSGKSLALRAMSIVIESGLLYLVIQLVYVVLFAIANPAENIAGLMAVQIYGISSTLIIIRVGLGLSDEYTTSAAPATTLSFNSQLRQTRGKFSFGFSTTHVTVDTLEEGGTDRSDIEAPENKVVTNESDPVRALGTLTSSHTALAQ